jgi:hypothetical protein
MTFYGTSATGAAWIVPKKYVEKVGEDGFKKAPIGAGPYKFVSFNPGIDLVLEAFDGYWRKTPSVKRLVFRSMPDETTRAAALKAGDVDIVYLLSGPVAAEVKRSPGLRLAAAMPPGVVFLDLPEQWDPKSPWHDRRVRLAASHALDRSALNQAETLGLSRPTGGLVPRMLEFAQSFEPPAYDPARAKKLHGSSIERSARRCSTRSSRSCTTGSCTSRSTSSRFSGASGRGLTKRRRSHQGLLVLRALRGSDAQARPVSRGVEAPLRITGRRPRRRRAATRKSAARGRCR